MREHDMGSLDSLSGSYMFRPFPYSIPFNSLALFSHQKERDEMLFFFLVTGLLLYSQKEILFRAMVVLIRVCVFNVS